ncbi:hypothetical protein HMPREF9419_1877 [Prevotella nigrescens ATCC 33563]|nr:hypothetical protein HMPREF9419_1877 [Prevotella nigrescens ATCC 33563]
MIYLQRYKILCIKKNYKQRKYNRILLSAAFIFKLPRPQPRTFYSTTRAIIFQFYIYLLH